MKKQLAIWRLILSSLQTNIPVMLLYVLDSKGSSPGRQGFFMAVNKNGGMEGSIGGGIMEHKFVEMARQQLQHADNDTPPVLKKQVHDKSAAKNQSGMICSGEQVNFIYRLQQQDLATVKAIMDCLENRRIGELSFSPSSFTYSDAFANGDPAISFEIKTEQQWLYKERLGYAHELYIIGGGHCALAFSKIMSMMNFYIRVYDTRRDLHTMNENHFANEQHLINSYDELKDCIPSDKAQFVVVMTLGYRTDQEAITALAAKQFRYFGVLGSKSKIVKLMEDLRNEGISSEILSRMHAPVGLPINSHTPEEIAVSIAGEIILELRFKDGHD